MKTGTILSILVATAFAANTGHAADPAVKCEAGKLKEASKYASCRLKAESKGVLKAISPDFTKCESKFTDKWGKTESKGGGSCPTNGDLAQERAALTADAVATAWRLSAEPRFVDNGNGTITDRKTNLMWEKKVDWDHVENPSNRHDTDNEYVFAGECTVSGDFCQPSAGAAAGCAAGIEGPGAASSFCEECPSGQTCVVSGVTIWTWLDALNVGVFAGHNDWRVPKREELLSLVYDANADPAVDDAFRHNCYLSLFPPCSDINSTACSCTPSTFWESGESSYFTATRTAIYYAGIWKVDFTEGAVSGTNVEGSPSLLVRAVRGGS